MKPHKWHKEIKAWADGAEIECYSKGYPDAGWQEFDGNWGEIEGWKFRIKPQPKEPQYLYVYADEGGINFSQWHTEFTNGVPYIGKIKLEDEASSSGED